MGVFIKSRFLTLIMILSVLWRTRTLQAWLRALRLVGVSAKFTSKMLVFWTDWTTLSKEHWSEREWIGKR